MSARPLSENPCACRGYAARSRHRRRGTILIVAMILIFAIAALVLVLGQSMRVEVIVAANSESAREASLIERGAEQYVMALLAQSVDPVEELQESYFEAVPLGEGYFWILRPDYGDPALPPFGLTDESAKVNLNYAPYESLIVIPGMTEDLAASIIDWHSAALLAIIFSQSTCLPAFNDPTAISACVQRGVAI